MNRHLSPREVAKHFGVSIKALRLYERHGLLTALRSEAGWRIYGPQQIARLHQVLALKRLNLPLARIAQLLAGRDDLDAVLALQEQILSRQSETLSTALALLRSARAKLASGRALSIDDLTNLNKETTMASKLTRKTFFHPALVPHQHKFFTPEEIESFGSREDLDQEQEIADWVAQIIELKNFVAKKADPAAPECLDLARRWRALGHKLTKGDPIIAEKLRGMTMAALADPLTAPQHPLAPPDIEFLGKMMTELRKLGEI